MRSRGRGRMRGGHGNGPRTQKLVASMTDDASTIADLTVLYPAPSSFATTMDDGSSSTVALTHTNPSHLSLHAPMVDDASTAAAITLTPGVSPGSQTFDTGASNFTTPLYNTLIVELWGGGAPGKGQNSGGTAIFGTAGGDTTVSTLSLTAHKGALAATTVGGAGGTATGGDTNTTGGSGGNSVVGSGISTGGKGGDSPNGGTGGAAQTTPSNTGIAGNNGNAPGGAGSGGAFRNSGIPAGVAHAGGGAGAYCKKTYTAGAGGAPVAGDLLAYSVGAGGAHGNTSNFCNGGDGAAGRVKFTWS